ncbi:UDP-glucose 4-epimerase GalE [Lentzea guizhouensis]|uniref:UDP-glucose 4-epimerase n=1 Tax=Lentzea guizhouensis TaxID=1586287 RepID=A0A1B2HPW3_9PSEU|nr:UDP-glucose 4-epimerase GalE [Lentzea guizhouensis]ANZ39731.1 UDP-glucose 4-epimerase GalE [Lentzea guizhouensis]
MRVLITGGAGYIGSFVVRELKQRDHEILVFDNLSTGRGQAVPDVPLVVADIRDRAEVDRAVGRFRPDAVMHFAALKSPAESMREPGLYYDVNVVGTANLLSAATAHGVRRFVFSSSCAVYGTPQVCPVDERAPLRPESPYGETKVACERMLGWIAGSHGMAHASLRYFNVAGAAEDGSLGEHLHEGTSQLVPRVVMSALGIGPEFAIAGGDYPTPDGTALRDYIHVEDLAEAHVRTLEMLGSTRLNGVYNLGRGSAVSVLEVVNEVERVSGKPLAKPIGTRRPGDPAVSWADAALAGRVLGWTPKRDLTDMVRSAWLWHTSDASAPA